MTIVPSSTINPIAPESRRLLRVKIDSGVDNSGIFADLMGDEVIKRREFIQDSIESGDLVANLDI